jgi:hypothetical protein
MAASVLDPAGLGAGSLAAVAGELIGPLGAGVTPRPLPWAAGTTPAEVVVDTVTRYPLALVTLLSDLEAETVEVTTTFVPDGGGGVIQPALSFEPYTPAGAALIGAVPGLGGGSGSTSTFAPTFGSGPILDDENQDDENQDDVIADDGTAGDGSAVVGPFTVRVTVRRRPVDGDSAFLEPDEVRALLRVDLVQGRLGRLLAVLVGEKVRLRRAARQIRAMRSLPAATGNALDRIGEDLSCRRFVDELFWDATRLSPGTRPLPAGTQEDDASYRARLRVLRGIRLPSGPWIDSVLNGPGGGGAGWLADVGLAGRAEVDEATDPQLLALKLVAPGQAGALATYFEAIRRVHLIWPAGSAAGDPLHAQRLLPPDEAARVGAQRSALATWQLPAGQAVAPALAEALRVLDDRCRQLGARPWPRVTAGQSDGGGSRFELGLGALLAAPVAAQLDAAVSAAGALADPTLGPRPRSADPIGAWLLSACGLRTAEANSDGTVFVSPAPMGALIVDVGAGSEGPVSLTLNARLASATDPNHDRPLVAVIQALAPLKFTPVATPATLLAGAKAVTAVTGLPAALAARSVPGVLTVDDFTRQLAFFSARDYAIFDLGAAVTASVIANPAQLAPLLTAATQAGGSSVVALVTASNSLALIFGVAGLPLAGSNLAAQHTLIYRWQVRALDADPNRSAPAGLDPRRGSTVTATIPFAGAGISVVSCLSTQRTGANDPYQWRPKLPPGSLLTLRQYEHLLNIVELVTPAGVRADTIALREQHVDVDGSGHATKLTPAAARAYRHYRQARSAPAGQSRADLKEVQP